MAQRKEHNLAVIKGIKPFVPTSLGRHEKLRFARFSRRSSLVVINKTKGKLIRLPFNVMKNSVLGARYCLEVVFVTPLESRILNKRYRKKNKQANVLSFPLSAHEGQLVICPAKARREAGSYGKTRVSFIGYLLIHGLLHLKGYRHGSTMEGEENRLSAKFLGR